MRIYTKYLRKKLSISIYKLRMILFQMLRVAIFLLKHEIDLLSLMFSGKEFQMEAPSCINFPSYCLYWALVNESNLKYHEDCGLKFLFRK